MVIPAAIRERAGLTPGSELEITEDELGVRLQRVAPGPKLVKIGRRLVARAGGATVVVTDNRRHFLSALRYGLRVETPSEFLAARSKKPR